MILGFKGFKPGLVATLGNGKFQYVPNELNETKKAMCASTGFHYCLDPWDCLNWYTWNGKNEFWAVAAGGDVDEDGYGSRSSCTKLVPLRKLTAEEFLLIRPTTISDYYNEIAERMNLNHLDLICEALDCSPTEILVREPNPEPRVRNRTGFEKPVTGQRKDGE